MSSPLLFIRGFWCSNILAAPRPKKLFSINGDIYRYKYSIGNDLLFEDVTKDRKYKTLKFSFFVHEICQSQSKSIIPL